jgi:hypothetical protein
VRRTLEEGRPILLGQVWRQLRQTPQVKSPVAKHFKQRRISVHRPSHRDPKIGFGFRKMKHLGAIGEHRRATFSRVEPAMVDFTDVRDQRCFDTPRRARKARKAVKQLVIRD